MLTPATLPTGWDVYQMEGWMGSIDLDTELKANLDYAPTNAVWELGKDYDSKALGTYELSFTTAFEATSDNVLTVTIKDVASGQLIEEKSYGVNDVGVQKIRYLATGAKTRIIFKLVDPTPNDGSVLEVTGIGLNKTDFGDYRYGFNGKENDPDWGKLIQDYGFRLYNPGIAKFLSVDPLAIEYPWYTPYQFAGDMPIWAVDLDGGEPKIFSWLAKKWDNSYIGNKVNQGVNYLKSKSDVAMGFSAAVIDNATNGAINLRGSLPYNDPKLYNQGQDAGDLASIAGGSAMIYGGTSTATGAGVVTVGSGGVATPVTVPVAAVSLGVAAEGGVLVLNGTNNLANQKGRVYANGKSGDSYSGKTKDDLLKSKSSYEKLIKEHKQKLDDFRQDPIGNTSPERLKQMTKDNPSHETLLKRAMGRVPALEKQIKKQQGELDKINKALKKID